MYNIAIYPSIYLSIYAYSRQARQPISRRLAQRHIVAARLHSRRAAQRKPTRGRMKCCMVNGGARHYDIRYHT